MNHEKQPEELVIKPEQELEYALDGINKEDFGDAADCLSQFATKLPESGLSSNDREKLKPKLEEIERIIATKEIPENQKEYIETMLERAKNAL